MVMRYDQKVMWSNQHEETFGGQNKTGSDTINIPSAHPHVMDFKDRVFIFFTKGTLYVLEPLHYHFKMYQLENMIILKTK